LLRLHPFEVEPALEAAAVGKADSMSIEAITVSPVVGGDQLALALAELRGIAFERRAPAARIRTAAGSWRRAPTSRPRRTAWPCRS